MLLLIPGPVMTHPDVRAAADRDIAPWDQAVREEIGDLLTRLRIMAGGVVDVHVAMPLPGSGHFIIEAAVRTFVPPEKDQGQGAGGGILIPASGQYAQRMMRLARAAARRVVELPVALDQPLDPAAVDAALAADPTITHLGMIYSETSTGIIHDPRAVGAVVHRHGRRMILDAVSAFGALPIDVAAHPEIDAMVFTANKCLESLPGFSLCVSPIARLLERRGHADSWSFDLADLYQNGLENGPGAARFTPPIQPMAALHTALDRLDAEGGPTVRLRRYQDNMAALYDGMVALGLQPCLPRALQGPIIMNVLAPQSDAWDLKLFVEALKRRGVLISNFRNTEAPSMRIGAIGAIGRTDIEQAVTAIGQTLDELGFRS
ncbi:aminotransferase class V-fold PLP-dependent enzyme [Acidisoma cellulosilytica]|uniref:Aminotransferase class V-fold PLP-dependent enzyme n=1 Tax=Acidisoma cellulosilyticum TaxID=2802395 RepID=A0A963Z2Y5_9PROT|nr:aminotransferase class V-fold PLP-dependent enzyme [Acidisoma cellulosilyticum]MCB8880838.1 aminotransferase class V-fold PLP-dependent enzyme [Acidisoma cellulosilyticum]